MKQPCDEFTRGAVFVDNKPFLTFSVPKNSDVKKVLLGKREFFKDNFLTLYNAKEIKAFTYTICNGDHYYDSSSNCDKWIHFSTMDQDLLKKLKKGFSTKEEDYPINNELIEFVKKLYLQFYWEYTIGDCSSFFWFLDLESIYYRLKADKEYNDKIAERRAYLNRYNRVSE